MGIDLINRGSNILSSDIERHEYLLNTIDPAFRRGRTTLKVVEIFISKMMNETLICKSRVSNLVIRTLNA